MSARATMLPPPGQGPSWDDAPTYVPSGDEGEEHSPASQTERVGPPEGCSDEEPYRVGDMACYPDEVEPRDECDVDLRLSAPCLEDSDGFR